MGDSGETATVRTALDAAGVRAWITSAATELAARSAEINALNVFPVADADTGTNLAQTMQAAATATDGAKTAGEVLRAAATGAVLGARGNSGVIIAQLLRSLADEAHDCVEWTGAQLASGLRRAVTDTYSAVVDPVEGTILTVARAAAAASAAADRLTMPELVNEVVRAADEALRHTPQQLASLARAGVIDAGGLGLVILLDALAEAVCGERLELTSTGFTPHAVASDAPSAGEHRAEREMGSDEYEYEIQYLLDAEAEVIAPLRARLAAIGDSVAVVGTGIASTHAGAAGALTWNVHVHSNDVGAAVEAGVEAGRPYRISVTRFSGEPGEPTARRSGAAVIAVAPLIADLFVADAVHVVAEASLPALVAAVHSIASSDASDVVIVHDVEHGALVAETAAHARAEGLRVAVVPTRSPVQCLAAIAVHDAGQPFDDDVVAMAEAAAATRFAEIAIAESDALTSVGPCKADDVLGLIDGDVVEIGDSVGGVALSLVSRVLAVGAELITVLVGAEAPAGLAAAVVEHVRTHAPLTEVTVYDAAAAGRPLIIGIE